MERFAKIVKGYILLENIVWEKVLFSVAGYLKQRNETATSIKICIGLVNVIL